MFDAEYFHGRFQSIEVRRKSTIGRLYQLDENWSSLEIPLLSIQCTL